MARAFRWRNGTLKFGVAQFRIVKHPQPEAWKRAQRYAPWMRGVHVWELWSTLGEDAFRELRLNSPAGGWFPALQNLTWVITKSNLPYADIFLPPHLKEVSIYVSGSWADFGAPHNILSTITPIISALPTSALQSLCIGAERRGVPWAEFKEVFSSVVLRCGPSLTKFTSMAQLSDAAINHLIRLPLLHTWIAGGPPPNFSPSSLPPVFPPLVRLTLRDSAACGWLPLFERLEHSVPATQGMTPLSRTKESLRFLDVRNLSGCTFDVSFTSPIQIFRNLITLKVHVYCGGNRQCAFKLNNNNATELAMVLSQLEFLYLGHPCSKNTCATTVVCLLPISAYCVKLRTLEIHFNTTNIVGDLKSLLEDPQFEALRSLPRCTLSCLEVYRIPLTLDESGFETVVDVMINLFPSLERCKGAPGNLDWEEISRRITGSREI